MQPQLLTRQLGSDLYSSPGDALCQLIANSLDADCSRVEVKIMRNELGAPQTVVIADDGRGITFSELERAFRFVGEHIEVGCQ